jgi:L-arabinose isomerase
MKETAEIKIGLFAIGLDTYWQQFPGLRERLEGYSQVIFRQLQGLGCEVIDVGLVDSLDKAKWVAETFRKNDVKLIFLFVSTYALSSTVLPIVKDLSIPIIVLNLQPVPAIDYDKFNSLGDRGLMTGEWLAHCQACAVPEIACVLKKTNSRFKIITGTLHDTVSWNEIREWVAAIRVIESLKTTSIGVLGHYYCGMLDVYSDLARLSAVFGCHFELLEMCELARIRKSISDQQVKLKLEQFNREFAVSPECEQTELERAAKTACALDELVKEHRLGALAYYYEGAGGEYEDIITSVIAGNSLLTAHGIPVAGECEIKNVIAMKIMDLLGCGGSFSEFYLADFQEDILFLGHDGPGHIAIAEGPVKLVPLPVFHGKPGKGLSIEMKVRHGQATLLSVVEDPDGSVKLLFAEAESVPGTILRIGNTNSRYKFKIPIREFINNWAMVGPSHHCAIGVGHITSILEKIAFCSGIRSCKVC